MRSTDPAVPGSTAPSIHPPRLFPSLAELNRSLLAANLKIRITEFDEETSEAQVTQEQLKQLSL